MSEPMHNWPASQWAIYYGEKADEAMRRGYNRYAVEAWEALEQEMKKKAQQQESGS
jgi:hypothetical protein